MLAGEQHARPCARTLGNGSFSLSRWYTNLHSLGMTSVSVSDTNTSPCLTCVHVMHGALGASWGAGVTRCMTRMALHGAARMPRVAQAR
jgi:hypothetical protein